MPDLDLIKQAQHARQMPAFLRPRSGNPSGPKRRPRPHKNDRPAIGSGADGFRCAHHPTSYTRLASAACRHVHALC